MKPPTLPSPSFKPPRPPNAWIIFRSEMMRTLPKVNGQSQADVSRIISKMWKEASDETRQLFERRADALKAEHQRMYPGYRFQPVKKEEKERRKEEKRLEKERNRAQSRRHRRHAPYTPSQIATHLPLPPQLVAPFPTGTQYGTNGPSPPISAASSPGDGSPFSDPGHVLHTPSTQSSNGASPGPQSTDVDTSTTSQVSQQLPVAAPQPTCLPIPGTHQWHISQPVIPTVQNIDAAPDPNTASNVAPDVAPVGAPTWPYSTLQEFLDVPDDPQRVVTCPDVSLQGWSPSEIDNLPNLQAFINPTGHADIFNFFGISSENLEQGFDLTTSMGEQLPGFIGNAEDPSGIISTSEMFGDWGFPQDDISSQPIHDTPPQDSEYNQDPLSWFPPIQSVFENTTFNVTRQQRESTGPNSDMMQYLDFETVNAQNTDMSRPAPLPHTQSMPLLESNNIEFPTNHHQPYLPPAGAVKASTRRVAGSWKHTYRNGGDESPLDQSPPREQWVVHAS